MVGGPRPRCCGCAPQAHRAGRHQRCAIQPQRAVRGLWPVGPRPRTRPPRARGVPAHQVAAAAMSATVRAAVMREVGTPLRIEEITLPAPGPNQVRVRMAATGVCHSDLSLARGTLAPPGPAVLGRSVLTGVGAVIHAAAVAPGDSVAVIGLGGVGLCAVQGARIAGASVIIAVDGAPDKADLARRLGATDALEPGPDLGKRIRALTDGRGVDHAIECVGRADTIRTAWSVTRRGGQATIVGLGAKSDTLTFNALEVAHFARTLRGSMYGNADAAVDIPVLLEHVRSGRLDLAALVTRRIGLDDVENAFAEMAAGQGARSLIVFEGR